jgi:hypothetical protein
MDTHSNIEEVSGWLEGVVRSFGLNVESPDGGGSLGEAIADAIAEDIASSAIDVQADPEGEDFPDNEPKYAAYKDRVYGRSGRAYGIRTGQTFSKESLKGQVQIDEDRMTMAYGTGQPPSRGVGGAGVVLPSDEQVTDVEKAYYLGSAARQPIDFYKIGPYAEREIEDLAERALAKHIEGMGG